MKLFVIAFLYNTNFFQNLSVSSQSIYQWLSVIQWKTQTIIVFIGYQHSPNNTAPSFLPSPILNLLNVQVPLFQSVYIMWKTLAMDHCSTLTYWHKSWCDVHNEFSKTFRQLAAKVNIIGVKGKQTITFN